MISPHFRTPSRTPSSAPTPRPPTETSPSTRTVVSPAASPSQPVANATVTARHDALAPYLERLAQKVLSVPAGFKIPILDARFAVPLKETLNRGVKDCLAEVGTNEKKTLEMAHKKFHLYMGSCGVIPLYWMGGTCADDDGDPKPGQVGRARVLDNFLNELVREFNADHPELALQ